MRNFSRSEDGEMLLDGRGVFLGVREESCTCGGSHASAEAHILNQRQNNE